MRGSLRQLPYDCNTQETPVQLSYAGMIDYSPPMAAIAAARIEIALDCLSLKVDISFLVLFGSPIHESIVQT